MKSTLSGLNILLYTSPDMCRRETLEDACMPRNTSGSKDSRQPISKSNEYVCALSNQSAASQGASTIRIPILPGLSICLLWSLGLGRPRECAYSMEPKQKPWSPKSSISFNVYTARSNTHRPQVHICVLSFPSAFSVAMVIGSAGTPSTRCSLLTPGEISPMVVPQL